ncbi:hypothetical protein BDW71DRAFT_183705 [Aspergillus fruticulosus]
MSYKSNYEPYTSQSLYYRPSSSEFLYPLGDLYPHVVALQLQLEDENEHRWSASKNFSGYDKDIAYWAEAASSSSPLSQPESFSKRSLRRYSESTKALFISRIRRLLSRNELRARRRFK